METKTEMKYRFMQLFGNCACISYLGKDRLRGPVDNVVCKNLKALKLLLNNEYYDALMTSPYTTEPHKPLFEKDSPIKYNFDFVQILHIDPFTEEHKKELQIRLERFNEFYEKVKSDSDYYFTISLNTAMIDVKTHKINKELCEEIINYLNTENLLNKCVFVGTKLKRRKNDWNYWASDFKFLIEKYSLKYIEIIDLSLFAKEDTSAKQFEEQFLKLRKDD